MRVQVPDRIQSRWCKHVKINTHVGYSIAVVLKMMNVTSQEFSKCWEFMKKSTTDEELFCLFKDAGFCPGVSISSGKLDFVRKVLQRYNDAKVFVCVCVRACVCVCVCVLCHCV